MAFQLLERSRTFLKQHLAACIFLLFALQPVMDIISFWLDKLGVSTVPTLLLRMLVLAVTALAGYSVSHRRKYYWYLAAVCGAFFVLHAIAGAVAGYESLFADFTNYIRVIQIPLFTLCFISFLRADKRAFRWMNLAFYLSFALITASVILSVVTHTNPYTYTDTQTGVLGWFSTTNSQASIVSMMTPILLCMAYRAKRPWVLAIVAVLACGQLYFLGTRLAYMAIFASTFGMIFVTAICGKVNKVKYAILVVTAVVCLAFVKQSPMYEHQMSYGETMQDKQSVLNTMSAQRGVSVTKEEAEEELGEDDGDIKLMRQINQIYVYYRSDLVQRFGLEKVVRECNFTTNILEFTGARKSKIMFCSMLMDELPFTSRLFGIERDKMVYKGESYDVENDFHGIYFLYGAVGLVLFLAFLAYFLGLIVWALIKDIRKYFTIEAGAYGISLLLALLNAYNTAGILRRPNASFYLSVILAVVYYLVRIKKYSKAERMPLPRIPLQLRRMFRKKKTT